MRHAILAAVLTAASVAAQAPCFERNFGTNLALGDDQVASQALTSFAFPFRGANVASLGVCSNGYVWLDGVSTGADYSPTEAELLGLGARFCPRWCDLYPPSAPAGGGVFFREVPASGGVPARAIVTWDRVPFFSNRTAFVTMQVQFDASGAITTFYDASSSNPAFASIAGVSAGGGAAANVVDLSTMPFNTGAVSTGYELFNLGVGGAFDLDGVRATWIPSGTNGYVAVPNNCPAAGFVKYGSGCPRNLTAYEDFAGAMDLSNSSIQLVFTGNGYIALPGPGLDPSYANQVVGAGDDSIHQGLTLAFPFPFAGGVINTVDLSSNGYLWLSSNAASDFSPSVAELLSQNPRIAGLWRDLDCSAGGQLFWDSTPTGAMATWVAVPNFVAASAVNTFQIKLLPSGDIVLSYGACDTAAALVGLSEGFNAADPGNVDLSASVPGLTLGMAGAVPLALDAAPGSAPVVGAPFTLQLANIPGSTPLAAFALGFTQVNPGIDLALVGMPGCRQFLNVAASAIVLPLGGGSVPFTLNIPNSGAFVGYTLYAQGIAFSPGFNSLGVVASNGGAIQMGI